MWYGQSQFFSSVYALSLMLCSKAALFIAVFQYVLVTFEDERFWGQQCSRDTVLQSMECLECEIP
jgi:hypothetical protein